MERNLFAWLGVGVWKCKNAMWKKFWSGSQLTTQKQMTEQRGLWVCNGFTHLFLMHLKAQCVRFTSI